jgi:DNA-binding response OmpR family regulator
MNKRILIIEDEKDIVEALRYNLEKEKGFSVLSASSGDDGVKLALEVKPHLVILDIGLPGLNGYEVCRMLRRDVETRDIPILMVTARVSESDKVLGLELGADDYITKPFGIRELIARVRNAIRRRESDTIGGGFDDGRLPFISGLHFRFNGRTKHTFKVHLLKLLVQRGALSQDKISILSGFNITAVTTSAFIRHPQN